MSDKEMLMEALSCAPASATAEEIIEKLQTVMAIKEGERQADRGELIPHEKVVKDLKKWISK